MIKRHILVFGVGSVGKRHMENLKELGCHLSGFDPRADRLKEIDAKLNIENCFQSYDEIDGHWEEFDGVVVASPPKFHLEQCELAVQAGLPVFLEKPLARSFNEGVDLLNIFRAIPDSRLLLGYTYRWWEPLRKFRDWIQNDKVGKPLHAKFVMSAHLADWHPWERYQDFFMASQDLGGGALLDESHFIDLMLWFFGMPESLYSRVEKLSNLEIETDDNVDILLVYKSGLRVSIHLDLYGRPHEKYILVTGDGCSAQWSFSPNHVRFSNSMEQKWEEERFEFERNDMFISAAREFLHLINDASEPTCSLIEGVQVMKILEACRISSNEGRSVFLDEFDTL